MRACASFLLLLCCPSHENVDEEKEEEEESVLVKPFKKKIVVWQFELKSFSRKTCGRVRGSTARSMIGCCSANRPRKAPRAAPVARRTDTRVFSAHMNERRQGVMAADPPSQTASAAVPAQAPAFPPETYCQSCLK